VAASHLRLFLYHYDCRGSDVGNILTFRNDCSILSLTSWGNQDMALIIDHGPDFVTVADFICEHISLSQSERLFCHRDDKCNGILSSPTSIGSGKETCRSIRSGFTCFLPGVAFDEQFALATH
jgi:hypothetical protein